MPMATQLILVSLIKQFSDKAIEQNDILSLRYFAWTVQHLQTQCVPALKQAILSFLPNNHAAFIQFGVTQKKILSIQSPEELTSRRLTAGRLSWQ